MIEYYKEFFQSIYEKNYLSNIVTYLISLCETIDINSVKFLLENLPIGDFLPHNKNETKNILLYKQKLFIEREFLLQARKKTKEVEKKQFDNRFEYNKIILEGFCGICEQSNIVTSQILQYKKMLIDNIDENNNLLFDCKKCNTENSCIIPPFQQTFL